MLSYFSQGLFLGVTSQMLLLYWFPNAYQYLLINGFYTLVHAYTAMNYYYGKYKQEYFLKDEPDNFIPENTVSIVRQGKSYIIKDSSQLVTPFDFILHSLYSRKDFIFYRIISYDMDEKSRDYEPCLFKFMNVTVTLLNQGGKSYSIHLSSSNYSYYVEDNVINSDVICYLLYEHYGLEFTSETLEYQLDFIDHEVKLNTIGNKETIIFYKDDYHILYGDGDNAGDDTDGSMPDLIEYDNEVTNDDDTDGSMPDLIEYFDE